jgi:hypothetical protein
VRKHPKQYPPPLRTNSQKKLAVPVRPTTRRTPLLYGQRHQVLERTERIPRESARVEPSPELRSHQQPWTERPSAYLISASLHYISSLLTASSATPACTRCDSHCVGLLHLEKRSLRTDYQHHTSPLRQWSLDVKANFQVSPSQEVIDPHHHHHHLQ